MAMCHFKPSSIMSITTKIQNRIDEIQSQARDSVDTFEYPLVSFSVRVPANLRLRLDLLADTLGYRNRNALLVDFLEEAADDASAVLFAEIKQGGGGYLTSDGLNFQQAVIAGLAKLRAEGATSEESAA
jgi:hypothetical protein